MKILAVLLLSLAIYHKSNSVQLEENDGNNEVESALFASEFQQLSSLSNIIEAELDVLARLKADQGSKEELAEDLDGVFTYLAADEEAPDLDVPLPNFEMSRITLLPADVPAPEGKSVIVTPDPDYTENEVCNTLVAYNCEMPAIQVFCPKFCAAAEFPEEEDRTVILGEDNAVCITLEVSDCKMGAIQVLCPQFCTADVPQGEGKFEKAAVDNAVCIALEVSDCKIEAILMICPQFCAADVPQAEGNSEKVAADVQQAEIKSEKAAADVQQAEIKSEKAAADNEVCHTLVVSDCKKEHIQVQCPKFCAATAEAPESVDGTADLAEVTSVAEQTFEKQVADAKEEDGEGRYYGQYHGVPHYPGDGHYHGNFQDDKEEDGEGRYYGQYHGVPHYPGDGHYHGNFQDMYPRQPYYQRRRRYPKTIDSGYYGGGYGGFQGKKKRSTSQGYNGGTKGKRQVKNN